MRRVTAAIEIDAPIQRVWALLADFGHWPEWGTSILAVETDQQHVAPGVAGRVKTIAGIWLPFEITEVDPGTSWTWKVAGVPATGHELTLSDTGRTVAQFTVAWPLAPYLVMLRIALRRLRQLAEVPLGAD